MRALLASVLGAPLFVGTAVGQTADQPKVSVGDEWRFVVYWGTPSAEPNRVWVVTSVTHAGIEGTENGEPLRLTAELNVLESPRHTDSNPKALSFPLEVGKRWRYTSDWVFKVKGSRGTADIDVAVVGHERVRVPAGEFDAFKLVSKGIIGGTSGINSVISAETSATYRYAPAARTVVKSVSRNPYLGTSTVDLVAFHILP
jgi:hypothetical protein